MVHKLTKTFHPVEDEAIIIMWIFLQYYKWPNEQKTEPAIFLAEGLYLDIKNPGRRTPIAENTNATVPVTKLYPIYGDEKADIRI